MVFVFRKNLQKRCFLMFSNCVSYIWDGLHRIQQTVTLRTIETFEDRSRFSTISRRIYRYIGAVGFLRQLGLLYKAFSIHLKHQKAQKLSLDEAISKLERQDSFLKETLENVMSTFQKACNPSGIMGTVSSQTLSSVHMILEGSRALKQLLKEPSSNYKIGVYTCLIVQVENLHAMGHFKEQFPSLLQYAQNLANTVYESIKRFVQRAAY